jgi:replicative DNA helicase
MCTLHVDGGDPCDLIAIRDELSRRGKAEEVSEVLYGLGTRVPNAFNVEHYARIVLRTAANRSLISIATKIAVVGYQDAEFSSSRVMSPWLHRWRPAVDTM